MLRFLAAVEQPKIASAGIGAMLANACSTMEDSHRVSSSTSGRGHIPEGVDPQSWLGFEEQIRERRFRALLESARNARDAGDALSVHSALEEARILRPDAPEVASLERQLLVVPSQRAPASALSWSRAAGAALLLVVGVTMNLGVEMLRPVRPTSIMPTSVVPAPARPPVVEPMRPLDLEQENATQAPASTVQAVLVTSTAEPVSRKAPTSRGNAPAVRNTTDRPRRPAARPLPTEMPLPDTPAITPPRQQAFRPPSPPPPQPADDLRSANSPRAAPLPSPAPERTPRSAPPANATARPAVTPAVTEVTDETRVAEVLQRYARAYAELNARAARDVWPSVDERALARAFENLVSQQLSFQDCRIDVRGETANASCRGQASYVGKVGSGERRTEPRAWEFELRRQGDDWKIENAQARRLAASASQ